MKEHHYYVYMLTTANHKMFYTGVTNNIIRRAFEHKNKLVEGFTKQYNLTKLVYVEHHTDVEQAIKREKLIKKWKQSYKRDAIDRVNPDWNDLYETEFAADPATSAG